jgi:predicted porin
MNKNIKLAVAGAVLALSASANAGIIIPAGDWTIDIGGNVNTFATSTRTSGSRTASGGGIYGADVFGLNTTGARTESNLTTGLLPNFLSVSGSTRQNDLDVAFTISINPGSSTTHSGIQSARQENRQAFMTFGDKSWGSVKIGKDIGVFASDAILNDMTLLGVGRGAGGLAGNTTTTGRIGSGFMYADWKNQINYTTPNMNGFQATVGISQAWNAWTGADNGDAHSASSTGRGQSSPAFDAKASYSFATNDVTGKIWVSGTRQRVKGLNDSGLVVEDTPTAVRGDNSAYAADIGANVNVGGFGLTGYYYDGKGIGQTHQLLDGFDVTGQRRDSEGGYVQGTYVLPTKTKLGVAWGQSKLDRANRADILGDTKDELWTVGAYHPLTKHLNLVAEYNHATHEVRNSNRVEDFTDGTVRNKTVSLGAILFF